MLIKHFVFNLIILQLTGCASHLINVNDISCSEISSTHFEFIETHMHDYFASEETREKFWTTYDKLLDCSLRCDSPDEMTRFLGIADDIGANVEFSETFSEYIEGLFRANAKCLLDSAQLLNDKELRSLVKKLKDPIFDSQYMIQRAMKSWKEDGHYLRITNIYYEP